MTEKFKLVPVEPTPEMLKAGAKEVDWYDHNASDCYRAMLAAAPDAPAAEPVAFEMDWPDFHAEAMGCGLEDRNITNRYEAMRYGWEEAIERCAESLPEELYTHAPDASAIIAAKDVEIADGAKDRLRLIETIKYLRGIAERGEGHQCGDGETVESFVLGYVKKLESEVGRLVTAIDEQMTSTHIGVFNLGDDPAEAIGKLMLWSQGVGEYFATEKCEETLAAIEQLKGKEKV